MSLALALEYTRYYIFGSRESRRKKYPFRITTDGMERLLKNIWSMCLSVFLCVSLTHTSLLGEWEQHVHAMTAKSMNKILLFSFCLFSSFREGEISQPISNHISKKRSLSVDAKDVNSGGTTYANDAKYTRTHRIYRLLLASSNSSRSKLI